MTKEFEVDEKVEACEEEIDNEAAEVEEYPGDERAAQKGEGAVGGEERINDVEVDGFNDVMGIEIFETGNYSYGFHCEKEKKGSIEMDGSGRGGKMRAEVSCVAGESQASVERARSVVALE